MTRLGRINKSVYLIIPKEKLDALGWKKGDAIDVSLKGKDGMILKRYKSE